MENSTIAQVDRYCAIMAVGLWFSLLHAKPHSATSVGLARKNDNTLCGRKQLLAVEAKTAARSFGRPFLSRMQDTVFPEMVAVSEGPRPN